MKKLYILLIFLLTLSLWGCDDHEADVYKGGDFVTFLNKTENKVVRENEDGIIEVQIGVAKKSNTDRTFSVTVDAAKTTAVEGQDYDFVNKNVTIPAGEFVGAIKIKGNYDNLTPEGVKLTLNLNADEALIQAGTTIATTTVNLSRFFEVTMDWLQGNWMAQDTKDGANDGDTYDMTIQQINGDTIAIGGLFGTPSVIKGIVSFNDSQIEIPIQQYMFDHNTLGPVYIFNVVGTSLRNEPIICNIDFKGITTGSYGILNTSYSGWFPYITIMTKEE